MLILSLLVFVLDGIIHLFVLGLDGLLITVFISFLMLFIISLERIPVFILVLRRKGNFITY